MSRVPRPDLFNGWDGSGDESFLYPATVIVEANNGDNDMFSDSEKKVLCNAGVPESNQRSKQGGFFSSLDIMTKEELSVASSGTPDIKTPFALLVKKNTKKVKHWSPRKNATIVPRRSPRKQMKNMFQIQKKSDLMKELFADSTLIVASQDDIEEEKGENETAIKRERSVSSEKLAKKSKQEKEVTRTHRKIEEKSFSQPKSDDKYLGSKKSAEPKNSATPPALKISPKKKFGFVGKLSKKVEEDVEVKPKFQFHQSKVFEEDVDPDFKDLYGGKPEKMYVSKKSKDNGSPRKKSGKLKILEDDFDTDKNESTKKSEKKWLHSSDIKENKSSFGKLSKKPIEKKFLVNRTSFTFLEEDKISAQKSKSKEASSKKESISSVFEVEDDPYVLEIQARKKMEAEKLFSKAKGRKRKSMKRMAQFSQRLICNQDETIKFEIPKLMKSRKKKKSDPSQKMIWPIFKKDVENESNYELEETSVYTPSIDELLKLPDRPEDGGKTMDEVLDELDIEIAERKKKHEEEMAMIDTDITAEKQRQEERRERMKKNAVLRDRLELEINESILRRMFKENTEYLRNIEAGRVESSRHRAFHKSCRTRQALYYTMITDPFTDDQLEWTLEELGKVWMKTKREQRDNNEYVWKVLLAECFIKFYMDHFGLDKKETEKKISETPLRKAVEDSKEENSSDDEI